MKKEMQIAGTVLVFFEALKLELKESGFNIKSDNLDIEKENPDFQIKIESATLKSFRIDFRDELDFFKVQIYHLIQSNGNWVEVFSKADEDIKKLFLSTREELMNWENSLV